MYYSSADKFSYFINMNNTNTHTPNGGVPIVWRNIHTKRKEKKTLICSLLRIAEVKKMNKKEQPVRFEPKKIFEVY